MDTGSDPNITFDAQGVCNYCKLWVTREARFILKGSQGAHELGKIVSAIQAAGQGKRYDCIAGISGGVDSSYVVYQAKRLGLRPLIVHLDNGWNSELSVKNIEQIVTKLGFDLYTHVVRWEEFRDIHLSFLKAGVVDIELPTDHAISAILYRLAAKHGVSHILSGYNIATEGVLPTSWVWNKMDWLNIRAIHQKYGTRAIPTFPKVSFWNLIYYQLIKKIRTIQVLDYLDYNKDDAMKTLQVDLGWKDYGGKHFESIFTRFYQGYILPTKFGIDKRKAHLSSLICSGQMTRPQALDILKEPVYDARKLREDQEFVLKKLRLTADEFEQIMKTPPKSHRDYPSYETRHYVYHRKFFSLIRPLTKYWPSVLKPKNMPEYT